MDEQHKWLWKDAVPVGKLTVLTGSPGVGKTMFTLDLASRVTTGRPYPDGAASIPVGGVLLFNTDDGLADTIRPTLDACGADVSKINYVSIDANVDVAESIRKIVLFQRLDTRMVVIDPIVMFCGGRTKKSVFHSLSVHAESLGIAIIAVDHGVTWNSVDGYEPRPHCIGVCRTETVGKNKRPDRWSRRLILDYSHEYLNKKHGLLFNIKRSTNGSATIHWKKESTHPL